MFYKIFYFGFLRLILHRVTDIIKHLLKKLFFCDVPLLSHSAIVVTIVVAMSHYYDYYTVGVGSSHCLSQGQTVVVDMDGGTLKIPLDIETEIPPLPTHFRKYLNHCLKVGDKRLRG